MACVGLAAVPAACGPGERPPVAEVVDVPLEPNPQLDVLFVIDNSGGMLPKQAALVASIPAFAGALEGVAADLHVGVVTSDMGTLDVPIGDPACGDSDEGRLVKGNPDLTLQCAEIAGSFLRAGGEPNYTGALGDALACMLAVGSQGCGFEAPLASMQAALDDHPANDGFRRPSAHLAVILLGDEDDCSAVDPSFFDPANEAVGPLSSFRCFEKAVACDQGRDAELRAVGVKTGCVVDDAQPYFRRVEEYVAFVKAQVADPFDVVVAAIVGDRDPVSVTVVMSGPFLGDSVLRPSCQGPDPAGRATPAVRLATFAERFPRRHVIASSCDDDHGEPLVRIVEMIARLDIACIPDDRECDFSLVSGDADTPLRACNDAATNRPCWRSVADPVGCPDTAGHLAAVVVPETAPPAGTHLVGECR
jgi:hypothetical protein